MKVGILKELNDNRVAITPSLISKLKQIGAEVIFEHNAGEKSGFTDADYDQEASVIDRNKVLEQVDVIISVNPLEEVDYAKMKKGAYIISRFQPYNDDQIEPLLKKYPIVAFSLDMIPRTSLAQSMDVLSSMASIAGYKAVLMAANMLPRYFPMMITSAGSIKPAKVLILGAGVAGLQAIATAKRLGAMVEAFDVRQAAKEEVESLGAKFVEVEGATDDKGAGGYAVQQSEDYIKRQTAEVQKRATRADIVITTAQLRGRKAPILITSETVNQMKSGSVIIDLAASTGGNCALTENNKTIDINGVKIVGNSALANEMAEDASTLFGNNAINLLKLMVKEGKLTNDISHEILDSSCIAGAEHLGQ